MRGAREGANIIKKAMGVANPRKSFRDMSDEFSLSGASGVSTVTPGPSGAASFGAGAPQRGAPIRQPARADASGFTTMAPGGGGSGAFNLNRPPPPRQPRGPSNVGFGSMIRQGRSSDAGASGLGGSGGFSNKMDGKAGRRPVTPDEVTQGYSPRPGQEGYTPARESWDQGWSSTGGGGSRANMTPAQKSAQRAHEPSLVGAREAERKLASTPMATDAMGNVVADRARAGSARGTSRSLDLAELGRSGNFDEFASASTGAAAPLANRLGRDYALKVPGSMSGMPASTAAGGRDVGRMHGPQQQALQVPGSMQGMPMAGPKGANIGKPIGSPTGAPGMSMAVGAALGAGVGGTTSYATGGSFTQGAIAGGIAGAGMGYGAVGMAQVGRRAAWEGGKLGAPNAFTSNLTKMTYGMENAANRAGMFAAGGMLGGFAFGGNKTHKRGFNSRRGNSIGR